MTATAAADIDALARAVQARPGDAAAHVDLGSALFGTGLATLAVLHFERAIALQPDLVEAHTRLVHALGKSFDCEPALAASDRLLALGSGDAQAWSTRARILNHCRRHEEALYASERAIALQPDHAEAHVNKAAAHLARFEFVPGWEEFEWRWQQDTTGPSPPAHVASLPFWQGDRSRRLLVRSVNSLGDDIRYASLLAQLSVHPQNATVCVDPRLVALFGRSFPALEFAGTDEAVAPGLHDEQLLLGSLPRFFLRSVEDFRGRGFPFLRTDGPRRDRLRNAIRTEGRLLCGLSWASRHPLYGPNKTLSLAQLAPLLQVDRVDFVELQYGDTLADREALKTSHGIELRRVDEVDNFNDIDGLASLVDACDVVVTTSNVTAHMAGALGKETLLLAPFRAPMWCRQQLGGTSLWYPTVHFFEQDSHGNWSGAIQAARHDLSART